VRFQTGGGSQTASLGPNSTSSGEMFGNFIQTPLGNRPYYPGKRPPYKPDVPCYTQKLPNVNGPAAAKSAPGGGTATAARVSSKQDKLKREADLKAIRSKLDPFGSLSAAAAPEKSK
jgi:hypothetical protein